MRPGEGPFWCLFVPARSEPRFVWLLTPRGKPRWVSHRSRALWLPAYAFAVVMLGTTLPTPLYPRYEQEFGFSPLLITVIFGV